MAQNITSQTLTAGSATQVAAADPSRFHVRIQNTSTNSTIYIGEDPALTVAEPGVKALQPGDVLLRDGIAATAALYAVTHNSGHPAAITVKIRSINSR